MPFDLIATSAFGLEAIVARELGALGYEAASPQTGRVAFRADAGAIARANLWLRSADRLLMRVGSFEAPDFDALFDGVYELPWQQWIGSDGHFPVSGRSVKSRLSSVPALQRCVKKAIVEKLRDAHHVRELDESGPTVAVEVALLKDSATLTIDTTGDGLHKRGYRDLSGAAPLRETMAAALVQLSFWRRERPMIDPFCGSGTICIEAAMIGRNIAPGINRSFAAESWPWLDSKLWKDAREDARASVLADLDERVVGTDIDDNAISMARRHAQRAGVADSIHFQCRPFEQLSSKRRYGCVVGNPPYGVRIDELPEVRDLYTSIPEVLAKLPTWSFFILTSWRNFESLVGRRADRRRKLYNAQLECTYFQFHGPKPGLTGR